MPRVRLELPREFPFTTEIPVRITDLNYGRHVGNDTVLALLHEARVRFLAAHGFREDDVDGVGMLLVDAVVLYKAQMVHGDTLRIGMAVTDLQRSGFDLVYQVTKVGSGQVAVAAKTGLVFFDYATAKVRRVPPGFLARFGSH